MDTTTAVVCLSVVLATVYILRLMITQRGDFEAGGRAGSNEFFIKAKDRKK